ncbi:hypothetical protein ACOMHN_061468 [Nucella lapillus]
MMGIKRLPRIHLYWSTDQRFSDSWISSTMPKSRFLKLNQYFHLRDTTNTPGRDSPQYDPRFKIRPFLNMLQPLRREEQKKKRGEKEEEKEEKEKKEEKEGEKEGEKEEGEKGKKEGEKGKKEGEKGKKEGEKGKKEGENKDV